MLEQCSCRKPSRGLDTFYHRSPCDMLHADGMIGLELGDSSWREKEICEVPVRCSQLQVAEKIQIGTEKALSS